MLSFFLIIFYIIHLFRFIIIDNLWLYTVENKN